MSALQSSRYNPFKQRQRSGMTWVDIIVVLAIVVTLVALMMPAVRTAREPARRSQCKNNLKQIGLALHNYHEKYQEFPPAYTVDEHGKPLHSWRTLILPFVDQETLYQRIDLSKHWNDPVNAVAFKTVVPVYQCPSLISEPGMTAYLAVTGDNAGLRPERSLTIDEITDGSSNTLAVVEVSAKHAVHWMSTQDADLTLLLGRSAEKDGLQHTGGHHTLLFDGSVRFLSSQIQESIVRALVTAAAKDEQIGLALFNYHEKYQTFPPAFTVDEHSKPLHSWRTLILPFMDQESLYQKIDLSKPWNDPVNAEAVKAVVPVYQCPSVNSAPEMTTYLAVTGDNTCLRSERSLNIREVTDGASNTLAVVEVTAKHAVHWMSPHDADLTLLLGLSAESDSQQHTWGYHGLLCDGAVRLLRSGMQESLIRALVSATAKDEVGEF